MEKLLSLAMKLANEIEEYPLGECSPSDDPDRQTAYLYSFREIVKRFVAVGHRINDSVISDLLTRLHPSPESIIEAYDLKAELLVVIDYLKEINEKKKIKLDNIEEIWEKDKIRIFISHRDNMKKEAKELANKLKFLGMTCFVAHDSIEPMSEWKNEIFKALETMEGFISFITCDYYESVWTNQEIGFALAKNVPIFLYSHDKADPKGFHLDIQAIKHGEKILEHELKKEFSLNPFFKKGLINSFCDAKDGTFFNAKNKIVNLLGLKLDDREIDVIVNTISGPAKYGNQLGCLLCDSVSKNEEAISFFPVGTFYRDILQKIVLNQHTGNRYSIKELGEGRFKIYDKEKDDYL